MGLRALLAALLVALTFPPAMAEPRRDILGFDALDGWAQDDHAAALATFRVTCRDLRAPDWRTLCALAEGIEGAGPARDFFERLFVPVLIDDGDAALFTGYYEPEIAGSRFPSARNRHPVYALPPELPESGPWFTRREIEGLGLLAGRGLELAWVEDPVALFFLQIQGSGRIRLEEGGTMRLGYGGANRREYRSVGQEMIARGLMEPHEASADRIAEFVRANPFLGQDLLWTNDSYVFFRRVDEVPAELGPLGAMNRSITPHRSVAVDPAHVPLGAPVWIEKDGRDPIRRLTVAQDTGSAIKGAQRADIFFGTGAEAGRLAGQVRDPGRMVVLLPIQRAHASLPERLG
ncbi:MAG: murein transglycosylase A [Paracoccaceae bacterium]